MKEIKRILIDEMYTVQLNGIALVGWIVAYSYGIIFLINTLVNAVCK